MASLVSILGKIKCGKWTSGYIVNTARDYTMFISYYEFSKYMLSGNKVLGFKWGSRGLESIRGNINDIHRLREFYVEDVHNLKWNTYEELISGRGMPYSSFNRRKLKTAHEMGNMQLDDSKIQIIEMIYTGKRLIGYKVITVNGHELYVESSDMDKYFKSGYTAYRLKYYNGELIATNENANYLNSVKVSEIDSVINMHWNSYSELMTCINS